MFEIITLFKNYSPTFFTFLNFYKNFWKVKIFNFFVGYTTESDKLFIVKEYISKLGNTSKKKEYENFKYNYFSNLNIIEIINNDISYRFFLYKKTGREAAGKIDHF